MKFINKEYFYESGFSLFTIELLLLFEVLVESLMVLLLASD